MKKFLILINVVFYLITNLAFSQDIETLFKQGSKAFENKDYKVALSAFNILANKGVSAAIHNLGYMNEHGLGIKRNYEEAFRLYSISASMDYLNSQYGLGVLYANGHGVIQNNVYAYMWFNIARIREKKESSPDMLLLTYKMSETEIEIATILTVACINMNKLKNCHPTSNKPPFHKSYVN